MIRDHGEMTDEMLGACARNFKRCADCRKFSGGVAAGTYDSQSDDCDFADYKEFEEEG